MQSAIAAAIVDRLAARLDRILAPPSTKLCPLMVGGDVVGYVDPRRARRLAAFPEVFIAERGSLRFHDSLGDVSQRTRALACVAQALADEGALTAWRNERYSVSAFPGGPVRLDIERAAARFFGIATFAVHVNATTTRAGETCMWIARRSATKAIDPGQLDNLVGGGVAAGSSVEETLVKESWEEAGIPAAIASTARPAGSVHLLREQPDGLQRETIYVHDLELAPEFEPCNQDGEVASTRLASIDDVANWVGNDVGSDVFTVDASVVIADWLRRGDWGRR